jgi:hypothetical protein
MAKTTENLGLTKPEPNDFYDIEKFNENWDKIDESLLDKNAKLLTRADNINTIFEPGFYRWANNNQPSNIPSQAISTMTFMIVLKESNTTSIQEIISISPLSRPQFCSIKRPISNTTLGTWEWVNPPLIMGTEYRTTERYKGEAVLVKLDSDGIIHKRTETGLDITPIVFGQYDIPVGSSLTTGKLYLVYE